ncbi:AAA family ATPase [Burkholderia glumae]|uniref:AAA family ATPase n=2 Tax=Burkholderia glumae TaxID=337 RepID=UPI0001A4B79A|nr:AAA family ATPase [Burkholderia glumae]ACR32883.1 Chromosome partition protein ParA [Burkholderia glumae BGR1]QJP71086.1 AAA family ATPase [Burkholderia glumae]UVS88571.1 ParA family protein [Burkholderia glumae]
MAAKIIAVFNQKGGSGKSTISTNLAGALGLDSRKTMVIDLDPQGTASIVIGNAPEDQPFPAACANLAVLAKPDQEIRKYVDDYEFIIIDCPPAIASAAPSRALLIADLGLIPVGASGGNVWAIGEAKKLGQRAQDLNDDLKLRTLANMNQNTAVVQHVFSELDNDADVPALKTRIGLRTAYKEAELLGKSVLQIKGAKEAHREIKALKKEILEILEN